MCSWGRITPLPPPNATARLPTRLSPNNEAGKVEGREGGWGMLVGNPCDDPVTHILYVAHPPPPSRTDSKCQIGSKGERTMGEMWGGWQLQLFLGGGGGRRANWERHNSER